MVTLLTGPLTLTSMRNVSVPLFRTTPGMVSHIRIPTGRFGGGGGGFLPAGTAPVEADRSEDDGVAQMIGIPFWSVPMKSSAAMLWAGNMGNINGIPKPRHNRTLN